MRILLVSNLYPPYCLGGYERLAAWTADGLRERGHLVHVLTGRGSELNGRAGLSAALDLDLDGLREAHYGDGIAFGARIGAAFGRHVFSRANFRATKAAMAAVRPELVSFWNPAFVTFSPLLAARFQGVPSVVHLSDTTANTFRNPHPPAFPSSGRALGRTLVDAFLRGSRPRRVIVPSQFLAAKLTGSERLPAEGLTVLPWPVPYPVWRVAPPADRDRARRLLFVGSLAREKGLDVLIRAFGEAWRERPELTLTVVGSGGRQEVRRVEEAAKGVPVRLLGRLEHSEVLAEYARHDVLVFPSVWDEPFAVVPLEAMAMGLVVIATQAGGTPEAVAHERTGLLVPPADPAALREAILRLAREPALFRSLAAAGRDHVLRAHDFSSFLTRLEDLYAEAAAGGRRPS
jgi:glycogen synthase